MEAKTKKILTIAGIVALVVVGYNYFTKDEDEAKSGFLGFTKKRKKITIGNPLAKTKKGDTVCSGGYIAVSDGAGSWTSTNTKCTDTAKVVISTSGI